MRAFEFKPKKKKKLNLADYQSNRPVNRSNRPVYRYEPFTQRILNSNLTWTGFRPNRSGIPVPGPAGLAGPIGNVNPGPDTVGAAPCCPHVHREHKEPQKERALFDHPPRLTGGVHCRQPCWQVARPLPSRQGRGGPPSSTWHPYGPN